MSEAIDFQDLFENGDLPLHIVGSDGRILKANQAELDLLGYSADQYLGRHIAEFHVDRSAIDDILARLRRGEKVRRYPARLRAKDGSVRHVQITANGRFEGGGLVAVRCFTVDVTEATLTRERGGQVERYWQAALRALPAAIYTTDVEGRITYFNDAAVELSGRTPELGSDRWCVTWRLFDLDGNPMPHDRCPMAVALRERRPVRNVEAWAERPVGTRVRFEPYPTPLYDDDGHFVGAVNLLIDVTEQRRVEADAARLAAIVRSADDAIVSKTLDGIVTSWNEAATRMFGYEAGEMIGQSIMRVIPPDLHHEEQEILAKLRRGERIDHFETVRLTKDGDRIDISLSVSPIRDRTGKLIGAAKVGRDITKHKQAEATQRLLLGELSHRVKNTLATVQSIASQTLRSARSPAEFVPSFLGRIQSLASAHGLLTQSSWQGVELGVLVETQLLADGATDDRVSSSGPKVLLHPQIALHLALVLHELGTNARKHGALLSETGRVSVDWSLRTSPLRGLHLQWRETGGPPVDTDAPPRAGFGTSLIERSVQSVEGGEAQMRFDANGINWDIWLPLPSEWSAEQSAVADAKNGRQLAIGSAEEAGPGVRILVVEDEPLLAMDIEGMLKDAGHHVLGPVGAIDDAMRMVARGNFDVALLDANLAGRPVDDLAATLTRRNIPFAFVTGYGRENLPQAFASAPVLMKPFGEPALLSLVELMLSIGNRAVPIRRSDRA